MVGDLVEAVVGDPRDGDPPLGCGDQIDVVEADAVANGAAEPVRGGERPPPDRRELD